MSRYCRGGIFRIVLKFNLLLKYKNIYIVMDEVETIKPSRKRPLLPDEDLFVSPLSYEGYNYCRNDIRLNSKFSYLYIYIYFTSMQKVKD